MIANEKLLILCLYPNKKQKQNKKYQDQDAFNGPSQYYSEHEHSQDISIWDSNNLNWKCGGYWKIGTIHEACMESSRDWARKKHRIEICLQLNHNFPLAQAYYRSPTLFQNVSGIHKSNPTVLGWTKILKVPFEPNSIITHHHTIIKRLDAENYIGLNQNRSMHTLFINRFATKRTTLGAVRTLRITIMQCIIQRHIKFLSQT